MKLLKALFAFYINSSIHVAFAVTALVGVTQLHFNLNLDWFFYTFIFLGTITGYNFVKYAKVAGLHHRSLANGLKAIQIFSTICAIGLFVVALQLSKNVLLYTAGFGVLTFLYAVPLIAGYSLRSVGGLKVFIVAIVWAGVTTIVPLIASQDAISSNHGIFFIQRFLLVIVWILPFEIRDVKYDTFSLGTLPQRLGINRAKAVGVLLLCSVVFCELYLDSGQIWSVSATMLIVVLSGILLINTRKSQRKFYASFWVESIPIWWYLLSCLLFHSSP